MAVKNENMVINLFEYKNREFFDTEHFDDLEVFLDEIWNKREKSNYYTAEENREEVQRFIQFFHKTKQLKSNKFVGLIHFKNHTINLLPKIFYQENVSESADLPVINAHILWWLSYCRKIKFPNYLSGLGSEQSNFFEILIYLFCKYTRELMNSSIYQKYNEIEQELSNIKGRINFNAYINENLTRGRHHKINCIYDSFEIDNEFNQCVKFVCKILISASIDYQNKRMLNEILFLLDEVSEVVISIEQCRRIQFNPIFTSFETIRDYCLIFLENSVSFNYKNDLKLFAFLLPMEYVFEDFVYGFIAKEFAGINPKGQEISTYLDENKNFGLKPDLVLNLGNREVIADTKYKLIYNQDNDVSTSISSSDLYQMVVYAIRFGIKEIKLFYPNLYNEPVHNSQNITVIDKLASNEKIDIKAWQLPIIDSSLTVEKLRSENSILKCFDKLKERLLDKFNEILFSE